MKPPTGLYLDVVIIDAVMGPLMLVIGLRGLWMLARTWRRTGLLPIDSLWSMRATHFTIGGALCVAVAIVALLAPIIGEWAWVAAAPFVLPFVFSSIGWFVRELVDAQRRTP